MGDGGTLRERLATVWPLFGLRIRTERLELRLPTDDDILALIEVARAGIHPPEEMPFGIAWTDPPSPAFEHGFVQHHWLRRGTWRPDAWFLNLMVVHDGRPIGSQSVQGVDFAIYHTVDSGSWLGAAYQGQGLGRDMRAAVLGFAFDGLGAQAATSSAFLDNDASNGVSRSLGYEPDGVTQMAPRGVAREALRWRMTEAAWRSRPRPAVEIEGLDACRDLFGV